MIQTIHRVWQFTRCRNSVYTMRSCGNPFAGNGIRIYPRLQRLSLECLGAHMANTANKRRVDRISSAGVRGDGTVGSNMGYGSGGMHQSTQMGKLFSSGLREAGIEKSSHRPPTLGKRSADDWLRNLDQQQDRVPTSGLGTVGGRADVVGFGRFGYRDWVMG